MPKRFRAVAAMAANSRHLEAGNRVIKTLNTLMCSVLAGALIFLCFLFCLKPWRELCEKEEDLAAVEKKRDRALLLKEQKQKELQWLITDSSYFEIIVRDKRDMANKGETIVRINRASESAPPPPQKQEVKKDKKQ